MTTSKDLFIGFNIDPDTNSHLLEASGLGLRPTGALGETFNRMHATSAITLATTKAAYTAVHLTRGTLVHQITFWSQSTAGATITHQVFGLLDASFNLLGQTADDTDTAWAASTKKTLTMATDYTITEDGIYYLGCAVSATTPPTLCGLAATAAMALLAPPVSFEDTTHAISDTFPDLASADAGLGAAYAYVS